MTADSGGDMAGPGLGARACADVRRHGARAACLYLDKHSHVQVRRKFSQTALGLSAA